MGKYYKSKKYQLRISLKDKPGLKQQELTDEGKEGLPERLDSSEHLHRKSGRGGGGGGGEGGATVRKRYQNRHEFNIYPIIPLLMGHPVT